jgi:hypothetical protein
MLKLGKGIQPWSQAFTVSVTGRISAACQLSMEYPVGHTCRIGKSFADGNGSADAEPFCGGHLERKRLQVLAQDLTQVVALESEVDGGLEHAALVTGIVAGALKAVAIDLLVLE